MLGNDGTLWGSTWSPDMLGYNGTLWGSTWSPDMLGYDGTLWGCTWSLDMFGYMAVKSPTGSQETVLFTNLPYLSRPCGSLGRT